jgi:hypothetical protein
VDGDDADGIPAVAQVALGVGQGDGAGEAVGGERLAAVGGGNERV